MLRTRIDAASVLADIRSGMSDEALMKKYRLTNRGLQSLFVKLADLGFLKYVRAGQALSDIRAGMSDEALMEKHRLSHEGLRQLFQQMDELGLLGIEELRSLGAPQTGIVSFEDMSSISTEPDRANAELETDLARSRLEKIVVDLVQDDSVQGDQITGDVRSWGKSQSANLRAYPRYKLGAAISVCFRDNRSKLGFLRDVTEQGLGIRRLESRAGEQKDLILLGDEFGEVPPFECRVQCKWAHWDERLGCHDGGFLIVDISEENRYYFEQLMRLTECKPVEAPGV